MKGGKESKEQEGKRSNSRGTINPYGDDGDDDSWQVSMLDIKHGEVKLKQEKCRKQQQTLEIQLQQ
jgi:hypothetical protein